MYGAAVVVNGRLKSDMVQVIDIASGVMLIPLEPSDKKLLQILILRRESWNKWMQNRLNTEYDVSVIPFFVARGLCICNLKEVNPAGSGLYKCSGADQIRSTEMK